MIEKDTFVKIVQYGLSTVYNTFSNSNRIDLFVLNLHRIGRHDYFHSPGDAYKCCSYFLCSDSY